LLKLKKKIDISSLKTIVPQTGFMTTLKICSMTSNLTGSGNNILLQTSTASNGVIQQSAFGIGGEHGAISQIGSMEQSQSGGVTTFKLYFQGSFSTSQTGSGGISATVGSGGTSVGASGNYSSTSSGFQSQVYVVYGNVMNGCPVALGGMIAPPPVDQ